MTVWATEESENKILAFPVTLVFWLIDLGVKLFLFLLFIFSDKFLTARRDFSIKTNGKSTTKVMSFMALRDSHH
jgi:hypothetical protein